MPRIGRRSGSRQPDIAAARTVVAFLLDVIEKRTEERCVEIRYRQIRRRFAERLLRMVQKQSKGVAVTRDGVWARLSLADETVNEERLQKSGKRWGGAHGAGSRSDCSTRNSAWRSSSGVAVRYQ